MSPFPQSVANPNVFPAVFLDPSLRGFIQVTIVLLHVPKNLEWPRWI